MHDPRAGRFFAVDPLAKKYPHYSPYQFSGNKVVAFIELEGLEEKNAIVAKEIESKDNRTYDQIRDPGFKVDTYVDCSEFVYEVVKESMGVDVGTYTENIKYFYESNPQALFETDFSNIKKGNAIMWVDKREKERTITHIGIVTENTKSLVTVTHASFSKNRIASNIRLKKNEEGNLNSDIIFVGLGRIKTKSTAELKILKRITYLESRLETLEKKLEDRIDNNKEIGGLEFRIGLKQIQINRNKNKLKQIREADEEIKKDE